MPKKKTPKTSKNAIVCRLKASSLPTGMTHDVMLAKLNSDLRNEWKHLRFYLHHASMVQGLHCAEYKEFLLEEAASEMKHVTEFSDLIVGLGGKPTTEANEFPSLTGPKEILEYALKMEDEVVANYVQRMKDADELGGVDGQWIEIFMENQVQHSREDADHMRQIVRGWSHFIAAGHPSTNGKK
jgi:bacterioferritin